MRKFFPCVLTMFALVMGTAVAQDAKKAIAHADVVEIMLLRQKAVRAELKLDSEEDAKKIYEFTHSQHEAAEKIHKLPEAEQKEKWMALDKANREFLKSNLSKDQRKRLKQIAMQTVGIVMLELPSVAKEIKLTPEQKERVDKMRKELRAKAHAIAEAPKSKERNEKLAEFRKEGTTFLMSVLTSEQRKSWDKMAGAPFKGKLAYEEKEKEEKK